MKNTINSNMKNSITRSELQKIHSIACDDWRSKIENYAKADPFSDTIKFTDKQIQEMVKASTAEQLPTVKEIFEIIETYESIKTLEDACKVLGGDDSEVQTLRTLQKVVGLDRTVVAGQELVVITRALNDKWTSDWEDSSEYKWFLWWYLGENFRLDCAVCCFGDCSTSSARLSNKSKDIALYSAKQFKTIWKEYLN